MHNLKASTWAWLFFLVGGTVLLAISYKNFVSPQVYTYRGMPLTAISASKLPFDPPAPAWMLVNDVPVQATYGSFCTKRGCADMVEPQRMHLATVEFPSDSELTVVVGAQTVRDTLVQLQAWNKGPSQTINGDWTPVEHGLVRFSGLMDPISGDQVLWVSVAFTEGGSATYLWRITSPTRPLTRVRPKPVYPAPYP